MGGAGSGRWRPQAEPKMPISQEMYIPNHDGISAHRDWKSLISDFLANHPHQDVTTTASPTFTANGISVVIANADPTGVGVTEGLFTSALINGIDAGYFDYNGLNTVHLANLDYAINATGNAFIDGELDMNTHKIIGVEDPTAAQDAATMNYVDDEDAAADAHIIADGSSHSFINQAVTTTATPRFAEIVYLNNAVNTIGVQDKIPFEFASKVYGNIIAEVVSNTARHEDGKFNFEMQDDGVLATLATLSGDGLDMNTHKILNVIDPTNAQDAATMNYVDTLTTNHPHQDVNTAASPYWLGNVGIGTSGGTARFHVHEPTPLGATSGNTQILKRTTGITANTLSNSLHLIRDAAGNDWTTARLHDSIGIDASFLTPNTDTRTYWERDAMNDIQSWGTATTHYMTLTAGNLGIGTTTPQANLDISNSGNSDMKILSTTGVTTLILEGGQGLTDYTRLNFQKGAAVKAQFELQDSADNDFYLNVNDGDYLINTGTGVVILDSAISSATTTITASADDTDVSNVNTLFVTTTGGAVVLGGLSGGVDGQKLIIVRKDTTNDLTLEHAEGAGTQDFIMHEGTDETIDSYGGFVFVCDGSDWYDCSHAKHV